MQCLLRMSFLIAWMLVGVLPAGASLKQPPLPSFTGIPLAVPLKSHRRECHQVAQMFKTLKPSLKREHPHNPANLILEYTDSPWHYLAFGMMQNAPGILQSAPMLVRPLAGPLLAMRTLSEMDLKSPTTVLFIVVLLADTQYKCST